MTWSTPVKTPIGCFRYEPPHRRFFSDKAMPKLYEETYLRVKAELAEIEFFCATTDMWTSRSFDPYMSLTVHWISDNWEMNVRSLQVNHGMNFLHYCL